MTGLEAIADRLRQEARAGDRVRPLITRKTSLTGSEHWSDAMVRPLLEKDIEELSRAPLSPLELEWLGAEEFHSFEDALGHFKDESVAPLVLERQGRPIAFANVQDLASESSFYEVGRTFVVHDERERGAGSVLLRHTADTVARALADTDGTPTVVMRTAPENEPGVALMETMTSDRIPPPPMLSRAAGERYHFFCYRPHYAPSRLGATMKRVRSDAGLTIAKLAFRTGLSEQMLRKIENGQKQPSLDALRAIVFALGGDDQTRIALLLGIMGEEPSDRIVFQQSIEGSTSSRVSVWVFSDTVAELVVGGDVTRASAAALLEGRSRFYFLPESRAERVASPLARTLLRGLEARGLSETRARRVLRENFAVWSAPESLCQLRIEVRNPRPTSAEAMTVEGPGRRRIPVSTTTMEQFVKHVREALAIAGQMVEYQGFERILIPELNAS